MEKAQSVISMDICINVTKVSNMLKHAQQSLVQSVVCHTNFGGSFHPDKWAPAGKRPCVCSVVSIGVTCLIVYIVNVICEMNTPSSHVRLCGSGLLSVFLSGVSRPCYTNFFFVHECVASQCYYSFLFFKYVHQPSATNKKNLEETVVPLHLSVQLFDSEGPNFHCEGQASQKLREDLFTDFEGKEAIFFLNKSHRFHG